MVFVKFTETGKCFIPRCSLSPRGVFSFNHAARKKFLMDLYSFAVFYYDSKKNLVGIELTNDENLQGAIKIRLRPTGADIAVKKFTDFFQITPKVTTIYPIEFDLFKENRAILNLKTS
jgi:hypothetical protein